GEVMLDVGVDGIESDDLSLHFTVTDTGIGIAPDKQQEIFGAFVQADASTTRRYGGTGLGLTISTQLVKLMGGHLWVESDVGKGSRFHFIAHFEVRREASQPESTSAVHLRDLRVLVVDSNATHRRILSEILAGWQMRAESIVSAPAALSALHAAADRA